MRMLEGATGAWQQGQPGPQPPWDPSMPWNAAAPHPHSWAAHPTPDPSWVSRPMPPHPGAGGSPAHPHHWNAPPSWAVPTHFSQHGGQAQQWGGFGGGFTPQLVAVGSPQAVAQGRGQGRRPLPLDPSISVLPISGGSTPSRSSASGPAATGGPHTDTWRQSTQAPQAPPPAGQELPELLNGMLVDPQPVSVSGPHDTPPAAEVTSAAPSDGQHAAVRTAADLLAVVVGDWELLDAWPQTDRLFSGLRIFGDASFSCAEGVIKDGRVVGAVTTLRQLTFCRRSVAGVEYLFTASPDFQTLSGTCPQNGHRWSLCRRAPTPESSRPVIMNTEPSRPPPLPPPPSDPRPGHSPLPFSSPGLRNAGDVLQIMAGLSRGVTRRGHARGGSTGSSQSSSLRIRFQGRTPSGPPSQYSATDRWSEPSSSTLLDVESQRRKWLGEAFRAGRISAATTGNVPREYASDRLLTKAFIKGQRVRDRLNSIPPQLQDDAELDPSERERRKQMREAFALGRQALREELQVMQEAMRELDDSSRPASDQHDDWAAAVEDLTVAGSETEGGDTPAGPPSVGGSSTPSLPVPPDPERERQRALALKLGNCKSAGQVVVLLKRAGAEGVRPNAMCLCVAVQSAAGTQGDAGVNEALDLVTGLASADLDGWEPAYISKALLALATAKLRGRFFAHAVAAALRIGLRSFRPGHLATTVWACAAAGHPAPVLLCEVEAEVSRREVGQFSTQDLITLSRAYGMAGHKAPALFRRIEAAICGRGWSSLNAQEISSILSGFAGSGHRPTRALRGLCDELSVRTVSAFADSDIATVFKACGSIFGGEKRLVPPTFGDSLPHQPSAPPSRLIIRRRDKDKERDEPTPEGLALVSTLLSLCVDHKLAGRLRTLAPKALSSVLWGCAKLGDEYDALFAEAAELLRAKPGDIPDSELASFAWAFSSRGSPVLPVLEAEGLKRLGSLPPADVIGMMWAFANGAKQLKPSPLLSGVTAGFNARSAKRFKGDEVALLARAAAGAGEADPEFLQRLERELQRRGFRGFNAERLAEVCWSLAVSGHRLGTACASALGDEVQRRALKAFSHSQLADVAWAAGLCAGSAAATSRCVEEVLRRGVITFSAEDWAAVAEGIAASRAKGKLEALSEEIAAEALQRHHHIPPEQRRDADVFVAGAVACLALDDRQQSKDHAVVSIARRDLPSLPDEVREGIQASLRRLGHDCAPDPSPWVGPFRVAALTTRGVAVDVLSEDCYVEGTRVRTCLVSLRARLLAAEGLRPLLVSAAEWAAAETHEQQDAFIAAALAPPPPLPPSHSPSPPPME
eukprot:Hpha_TRINITY_DN14532_c0_g1::TRINITY_DN14532_c0_g1_i1::g.46701::m.46701